MKGLGVAKIVKRIMFEGVWGKLKQKSVPRDNHSQKISSGIADYGKSLISVFQEVFASLENVFILAGTLGTRLSFYKI